MSELNKLRAIQQGYDAFRRGLPIQANPYAKGDPCRRAWSRGWKEAQFHHHNPKGN